LSRVTKTARAEQDLEEIWFYVALDNVSAADALLNTQVMRLRRKLEVDPTKPKYICTERGVGYLFGVPVEVIY
jgi:DNA-binding response OmpR family regulator